jgi:hypothetical protein
VTDGRTPVWSTCLLDETTVLHYVTFWLTMLHSIFTEVFMVLGILLIGMCDG